MPTATQTETAASAKSSTKAENVLTVNNIEVIYDHVILVLKGVSLDVPRGGIVALLGANGAGKTTTLKAISNLLHAERGDVTKGAILFEGNEVQDLSPNELVRRGCIQVMEGRQCFAHLTIEENLLTGAFTRKDGRAAIRKDLDLVYSYFPKLAERKDSLAGYTSGGEQQMCAVGRALMSRPKMILLDEPSMGLAPQIVEEIFGIVKNLNEKEGVSFLLAEQNTNMALKFARYGYILENGRVVMDATPNRWPPMRTSRNSTSASPKASASRSAKANTTAAGSAGWLSHPFFRIGAWPSITTPLKPARQACARAKNSPCCRRSSRARWPRRVGPSTSMASIRRP
jgi:branched-chain amino acid transport system ATP-binding protein